MIQSFFSSALLSLALMATAAHATPPPQVVTAASLCGALLSTSTPGVELSALPHEVRSLISRKGPYGSNMAVRLSPSGEPEIYGVEAALKYAKPDVIRHKDMVLQITASGTVFTTQIGRQRVTVTSTPALSGSAVQSDNYGDVDIETVIMVQYDTFTESHLHDRGSVAARALAQYMKFYVQHVLSDGRYSVTDFKSGELDHVPDNDSARRTKSRAIKWSVAELLAGHKSISMADGSSRVITLEESLVSESRTKIDWRLRGPTLPFVAEATGILEQDIDANILIQFAGQRGGNTPVLRVAQETSVPEVGATGAHVRIKDTAGFSPLRLTTIAFKPEHAELLRQLSVVTPPQDVFYTNANLVSVTRTYRQLDDYYKVIKRLARRLYFWNDLPAFVSFYGLNNVSLAGFQRDMLEIVGANCDGRPETCTNIVSVLHQLQIITEMLVKRREQPGMGNVAYEREAMTKGSAYLTAQFPGITIPSDFAILPEFIESLIRKRVNQAMSEDPNVARYIDFVLYNQDTLQIEPMQQKAFFITFRPDDRFVKNFRRVLPTLVEHYPHIRFSQPEDLHMTVSYIGKTTGTVSTRVQEIFMRYNRRFASMPFHLANGSLRIIGSNNNQIGVVFDSNDMPPEMLEAIQAMKFELVQAGLRPDKHLEDFLPHVSLGHLRDAYFSPEGHREVHALLGSSDVPRRLMSTNVSGGAELLTVNEELPVSDSPQSLRYSSMTSNGIEGLTVEDLDRD